MSISRDTPLGTLRVAPDPVDGGDVVDFPRRTAEDPADSLAAIIARVAASDNELRRRAAAIRANPPTNAHEAAALLSDAFGASVAILADRRPSAQRPNLRVVANTAGGAA